MKVVNQAERAYRAWSFLVEYARDRRPVQYQELAQLLGIHPRPIRYVLDLIQQYCLTEKLPPLTILVVGQKGRPGTGFIAWDVNSLQEGLDLVYAYPWTELGNPFQFASQGDTWERVAGKLLKDPSRAHDVYAQVKVRRSAQIVFREALLIAYKGKCAFSGIAIPEVLEAAHIIPWSECNLQERLDPRNGLLLTSLHHKMFDSGKITIREDYTVWVSKALLRRHAANAEEALLGNLHGAKMNLPDDKALWPLPEVIRRRNGNR